MENLVINYLEKSYTLSVFETPDITIVDRKINYYYVVKYYNKIIYWEDLVNQLITIFGLNEETIKSYVDKWASSKEIDLLKYWELEKYLSCLNFRSYVPMTIAMDLVPVQSMSMPNMNLHFIDYKYNEPWYIKLKNKIIMFYFDVKQKISTFVNKS